MEQQAWLDSLSEDWVSEPRSAGSLSPSLPCLPNSGAADSSNVQHASRIPKFNPAKQSLAPVPDSPLSERSQNEANLPVSQRSPPKPSKLCAEIKLNPRGRQASRTLSVSTTHTTEYNTVQHRKSASLSPTKLADTPEWKRRLLGGDVAYGEQRDLFSPVGLESIFRPPPSQTPSPTKLPPMTFGDGSIIMPSSPPVYKLSRSKSQSNTIREDPIEEEPRSHQQPRKMNYTLVDQDTSEFSRDDLSRSSNFQAAKVASQAQNQTTTSSDTASDGGSSVIRHPPSVVPVVRTASGQSDIRNEDLSPIFLSRVSYVGSNPAKNESQSRLEKIREEDSPRPTIEHIDDASDPLPSDLTMGTDDNFGRNGLFVNLRRGGRSNEGSFQKRGLSPSSLQAIDESAMLPEESMQASTPKNLPKVRRTGPSNEFPQPGRKLTPPSEMQTPRFASPTKSQQKEQKSSSGSPLKLFGAHDTFTNQKLLRRLSQFEGKFEGKNEAEAQLRETGQGGNGNPFSAPSSPERRPQSSHLRPRSSRKPNSFGEGELDSFQFSEDISRVQDNDNENTSLPVMKTDGAASFKFHLEHSPSLEENVVIRQTKHITTTSTTQHVTTTQTGYRPATASSSADSTESPTFEKVEDLRTPRKRNGDSEGKRLPKTPLKDPNPKRRRTLQKSEITRVDEGSEIIDSLYDIHDQTQSVTGRKRKDARHQNDQQAAHPKVLAMRQILRPRTPTPSQRGSQLLDEDSINDPDLNSADRARKLQERKIAKIQAELDSTDPMRMSIPLGFSQQMQDESRKGSVTTQDFLDEAKKIMAGIRGKARPRSGLASLEESELENDGAQSGDEEAQDDEFEDSYQESTKEPFDRPPSRDGQPVQRLPRMQSNPALLDHLRKYQEMSDMDGVIASSMRSLAMAKEFTEAVKQIDRMTNETMARSSSALPRETIQSEPANIRISQNPEMLRKRKHSGSTVQTGTNDPHEPEYPTNGSNASSNQSTSHSIPTGSSRGSESRRVIAPHTVSHLIPEELAGMVFDRETNKWVKRKSVSIESGEQNTFPSDETEEDPFGDIPDLSVDESQELQRLKAVAARQMEDALVAQEKQNYNEAHARSQKERYDFARHHPEIRPSTAPSNRSSPDPPKATRQTSSPQKPKVGLASWGTGKERHQSSRTTLHNSILERSKASKVTEEELDEEKEEDEDDEEVEREISILEDRVNPNRSPRRRNVTISFSSPLTSIIHESSFNVEESLISQAEQETESEKEDAIEDSVIIAKRRTGQRTSSTPVRSAFRHTSRRLSLGGHQFSTRPVSRIDEQDEESLNGQDDPNRRSISIIIAPQAPSRIASNVALATPRRPSHEIGTLTLTPLSDFTMHHADVSLGLDVSYVEKGQRLVLGENSKKTLSLSIKHLIEKLSEVEPFEPYWEDMRELDLKEKELSSLHKLEEFCERLEELDVSHNQLSQLDGIPKTLRRLRITHNHLNDLAAWGHLSNLQYIDVSNNDIASLSAFKGLVHLRSIRADNNKIKSLEGITRLDGLLSLRCRGNEFESLNTEGTKLHLLTELDLKDNKITEVKNLHELQALISLNLENNELNSFSIADTETMSALKYLKLSNNNLESIDVSRLQNLRVLYLDNNRLGSVKGLHKTQHLDSLSLREQQDGFKLDPSCISDAFEVRKLFLSGNYLKTFKPRVNFLNLQYLELANCGLQSLPEEFGEMVSNTRVLNLNFNAIKDIRPLIGIVRLKKVFLAGNRIKVVKTMADVLAHFPSLTIADLRGNPVTLGFYSPVMETRVVVSEGENANEAQDPFILRRGDKEQDGKYTSRLDMRTKILRRMYEYLALGACSRLKLLDGLDIDRSSIIQMRDNVHEKMVAMGILVSKEKLKEMVKETLPSENSKVQAREEIQLRSPPSIPLRKRSQRIVQKWIAEVGSSTRLPMTPIEKEEIPDIPDIMVQEPTEVSGEGTAIHVIEQRWLLAKEFLVPPTRRELYIGAKEKSKKQARVTQQARKVVEPVAKLVVPSAIHHKTMDEIRTDVEAEIEEDFQRLLKRGNGNRSAGDIIA